MKETITMWRHTQMVVLVALSAAIYAAVLIPFKGFTIIPGFTEVRPANVFPFVFGLLFGPAGAWGAAIGNLIGDFFGTLGIGSVAGFVGNFFLGFLPYKMWGSFFRRDENMEQNVNTGKKLAVYIAITILASAICAVWIAWFNDLIGLVPFAALGAIITVNNAIAGIVLGPILLLVLYPRVKRWGLLWTEIMSPEEVSASRFGRLGNILMWIGGLGALILGLTLGLGLFEQGFAAAGFAPGAGGAGGATIGLALLPFIVLIVVASFMLGGREQVEAAQEESGAGQVR
ncbi:MAG TPA: QueT transporter family protein [Rubrobacteraceae bacterium]|nr:QueT transporter family protein [Rubrobacteraceae bacterium]